MYIPIEGHADRWLVSGGKYRWQLARIPKSALATTAPPLTRVSAPTVTVSPFHSVPAGAAGPALLKGQGQGVVSVLSYRVTDMSTCRPSFSGARATVLRAASS